MKRLLSAAAIAAAVAGLTHGPARANTTVRLTIETNDVAGGTFNTPVFAAFTDGSASLFETGTTASTGVEALAEDGNNAPAITTFTDAGFVAGQVLGPGFGAGSPPVFGPGTSASADFTIAGSATRLILGTMVLPTNDWFLGTAGDGLDISDLSTAGTLSFELNRLYDAGTENEDFNFSAANGLPAFASFGLPAGQGGPNQGPGPAGGVVTFAGTIDEFGALIDPATGLTVADPFAAFVDQPAGFNPPLSSITVTLSTVSAIPEPSSLAALGLLGGVVSLRRRRRRIA